MRMHRTRHTLSAALSATVSATVIVMALSAGAANAAAQVTIPVNNPHSGQTLTVSGTGFPAHQQDPTGVQILECSDPGGSVANLPTDSSTCDGATQNPLPVNTDANGSFSTQYTFASLQSAHGASNVTCNTNHFCVIWVGIDYNQKFLSGPHAFSTAFEIGGTQSSNSSSTSPLVIILPIVVVVVGVGALIVLRRRRANSSTAVGSSTAKNTERVGR
jgi:hypothetical protein